MTTTGRVLLRLAVQLVLAAVLVVAAGMVFANSFRPGDLVAPLVIAAVVPLGVQLLGTALRWPPLATVAASIAVLVLGLAAWTSGAEGWPLEPITALVVDGPARILTSSIPAPDRPELLGVPVVLAFLAATASAHLVARTRSSLAPALPPVVVAVVAGLFGSTGLGWEPDVTWALVAGAVALGALRAWWEEVDETAARLVVAEHRAPTALEAAAGRTAGRSAGRRRALLVLPLLVALPLVAGVLVPALPGIDDRDPVELRDRYALAPDTPVAISPLDDLGANFVDDPRTDGDEREAPKVTVRSEGGIPVSTTSQGERVVHITEAVLDTYDGARWIDTHTYEAAGTPLPPDPDTPEGLVRTTHRLEVEVHHADGVWLPTVGRATELSFRDGLDDVAVDPVSGALISRSGRPEAGTTYQLVAVVADPVGRDAPLTPGLPPSGGPVTDIGTGDTDLSAQLERLDEIARAATPGLGFGDQLAALERLFHNEVRPEARPGLDAVRLGDLDFRFVGPDTIAASADVDPDAEEAIGRNVPTGHSLERILRFLYTPNEEDQLAARRGLGTPEQFATAFVLLARSQGIPARVAVGYTVPVGPETPTTVEALARHADAWPEVYTADRGWVPFSPTPEDLGRTVQRPDVETTTTTAAPVTSTTDVAAGPPTTVLGDEEAGGGDDRDTVLLVVVVLLVLVALLVAAAAPVLVKVGRRRRRRRLPTAGAVAAAWDDTAEHLVGCGVPLDPSMTAGQATAAVEAALGPATGAATGRLARLVELAACGPDEPPDDDARRAWSTANEVRRNASRRLGGLARLRAALDLVSSRQYRRRAEGARRDLRRPLGAPAGSDRADAVGDGDPTGAGHDPTLGLDLRLPATGDDGRHLTGVAAPRRR